MEPWIEIWDRGRSESDIDFAGSRAHAAPKVVNGKIEKVVVTQSGAGYIDPVAIVRDAPPKHIRYWVIGDNYSRKWKCTYMRLTEDGHKIECGHIQPGLYPPEYCPGETDNVLPYEDENGSLWPTSGDDIVEWMLRHNDAHKTCAESGNPTHLNARFLARKCWGTKMNYILDDDAVYRNGLQEWAHFDANLTVITDKGKIREIVVDNPGSNYYGSSLYVEGSGAGVDAIPVFDEYGLNTRVIFDDPRIKNIEIDLVDKPSGAGQGFRERPWAWMKLPVKTVGQLWSRMILTMEHLSGLG